MTITRGRDGGLFAFSDLKREDFPVTITAFVGDTMIWERVVKPYVLVDIPAATKETAGKIRTRIRYGNGEERWLGPVSEEEADAFIESELAKEADV